MQINKLLMYLQYLSKIFLYIINPCLLSSFKTKIGLFFISPRTPPPSPITALSLIMSPTDERSGIWRGNAKW